MHTVRAVGAVTRAICAAGEGETLGVRGPFGRGWPVAEARVATCCSSPAASGWRRFAPAIYGALRGARAFGRVIVLYGGRTPEQLLFAG